VLHRPALIQEPSHGFCVGDIASAPILSAVRNLHVAPKNLVALIIQIAAKDLPYESLGAGD
jgi:hypothetical protein